VFQVRRDVGGSGGSAHEQPPPRQHAERSGGGGGAQVGAERRLERVAPGRRRRLRGRQPFDAVLASAERVGAICGGGGQLRVASAASWPRWRAAAARAALGARSGAQQLSAVPPSKGRHRE